MTSIHASIPSDQKDEVLEAKRRGEIVGTVIGEDAEQRPTIKGRSASSLSSVVFKKLPESITGTQSARSNFQAPASEDGDDESEAKENDPLLSRSPVPAPTPRRPTLAKRPLSDLPIVEPEYDVTDAPCLSSSEQNVANNVDQLAGIGASDSSRKGLQVAERSQGVNVTGWGLQETRGNGTGSVDFEGRPTKRICSDSGKENTIETWAAKKLLEKPLPAISAATKVAEPVSRIVSVKGKSRVGLRRL